MVRDSAGNLYGTTNVGGTVGMGTAYKVAAAGGETVLYSFPWGADGYHPTAGVTGDPTGNLYGTTSSGGTAGYGVVYKVAPTGHETVLYRFTGGADGGTPTGGVILDSAGNLYGTTTYGGASGAGVVFKLDATGSYTVLYTFTGGADGGHPYAGVIRDSAGNLYGTAYAGGSADYGVVYELDTTGHETVLYSFSGGNDGARPYAGVIRDSPGNLYGTTEEGGVRGVGIVYELDSSGYYTPLYAFFQNGIEPLAGVTRDSAGNLYGTTSDGGSGTGSRGTVYELEPNGLETTLHLFTGGSDGGNPEAGVILDSAGNLYGTASAGGSADYGVVYKLDPAGNETVLYNFTGGADGGVPAAGLTRNSAGDLCGTALLGGKKGGGVVFVLRPQ